MEFLTPIIMKTMYPSQQTQQKSTAVDIKEKKVSKTIEKTVPAKPSITSKRMFLEYAKIRIW